MGARILALVAEPVSGAALRSAIGSDKAADAEVLVIAPALSSRLRFWMSDTDRAIERAEAVQQETVERLDEEGIDAAGDVGEPDPVLAIQDALQTYPADEIVLFTHPDDQRNWLEQGAAQEIERRFGLPVSRILVER